MKWPVVGGLMGLLLTACASERPPVPVVDDIDLERFMGDWYVIACIPTFLEKDAYNAVENYKLDGDGNIATTFTYRKGGFDGPVRRYTPTGFVEPDSGNAVWGMQFVWPIRADYRIAWIDPDYSMTIIARNKRDYVWLMAREPSITADRYADARERIAGMGYDLEKFVEMPQQPKGGR